MGTINYTARRWSRLLVSVALLFGLLLSLGWLSLFNGNVVNAQTVEKVVFVSDRDGNAEIYSMNPDGSSQSRLTNSPGDDFQPKLSPDGSKIVFTSRRDGNPEIYVMGANGANQTRLTNDPADDALGAWSPDGSKLTFSSKRTGVYQVYTMNSDGSNQSRLTNGAGFAYMSSYSPDGSKILFSNSTNGGTNIAVMNADGSGVTQLSNLAFITSDWASWSPDGSKIVFFSNRSTNVIFAIHVMNSDGSGVTRLTNDNGNNQQPAWSSDGSKIVFNRVLSTKSNIWIMNADGSGQSELASGAGAYNNSQPFWGKASTIAAPTATVLAQPTATTQPTATAIPATPVPLPGSGSQTFSETGKIVTGIFLDYWKNNGGLPQQGFPISNIMSEVSDLDGKTYTVQYFERAVFEYHPEQQDPKYKVLLSQLGTFQYKKKYGAAGAPNQKASTESPLKFPETGKTMGGKFRAYWEAHGGLPQQGYPISDEFQEVSDLNGQTYTVQYFERAVFELHPENAGTQYEVLLSQLGKFQYDAKYGKP